MHALKMLHHTYKLFPPRSHTGSGVGSAAVLSALTFASFKLGYKKKTQCRPAVLAQLAVAASITVLMYQKWGEAGKVHTLIMAVISATMSAYYVWNLTMFTPHFAAAKPE